MNRLRQFWHYTDKVFGLPARLRDIRDRRSQPVISTRVFSVSLLLGAVVRAASLLALQAQTGRRGWQRQAGWKAALSDDAFGYVLERHRLEDWRSVRVDANRTLKANKALEPAKINGLLVVALDANEQFHSRGRCCPDCCRRQVAVKDASGQAQTVTGYYHRQVYAQLHGPDLSVSLDLEPIRPGEDEAAAALRLLGRMRRLHGPRFFDAVTVDAWYATGPFLGAVRKLGWGVENRAFNELTQHYHLEHGPHHEPVAILAWLLIRVLGFNLFEVLARLHGKLWRQGRGNWTARWKPWPNCRRCGAGELGGMGLPVL